MIFGTVMYAFGVLEVFVGGVMVADAKQTDDLTLGLWGVLAVALGLFLILLGGYMAALT